MHLHTRYSLLALQVDAVVREAACGVLGRDDVGLEEPLMSGVLLLLWKLATQLCGSLLETLLFIA